MKPRKAYQCGRAQEKKLKRPPRIPLKKPVKSMNMTENGWKSHFVFVWE